MNYLRRFSGPIATISLFAFLGYYIANNEESLNAIRNVPIMSLVVIALMKVVFIQLTGMLMDVVLKKYGKTISASETFYLSILSSSGNYFGPLLGGTSIRAVYLKKKHNLSYSKFASALASYYFVLFTTVTIVALASLIYLQLANDQPIPLGYVFFGGLLSVLLTLFFLDQKILSKFYGSSSGRFSDSLEQLIKGWEMIKTDPQLMKKLFLLGLGNIIAQAIIVWVEFSIFAESFTLANILIYTAISLIAILFAITPGAIGIREGLLLLSTTAIGLSAADVVEISLIDRGVSFVVLSTLLIATRVGKVRERILKI